MNEIEIEAFSGIVIPSDEAERLLRNLEEAEAPIAADRNGDQVLAAVQ